jgi:hypothetical protein
MEEEDKNRKVRKWTAEEDQKMIALVEEHGTRHWTLIGSMLEGRSGKQVILIRIHCLLNT